MIALQPALKFNGGGHINHSIFWTNLAPNSGGEPTGICCSLCNSVSTVNEDFNKIMIQLSIYLHLFVYLAICLSVYLYLSNLNTGHPGGTSTSFKCLTTA